jgi:hypothetical protein
MIITETQTEDYNMKNEIKEFTIKTDDADE